MPGWEQNFRWLWTAQTISKLGSQIGGAGLRLTAILTLAATPAQLGLLSALGGASVLVFGLAVGVWADRVRRRPLLLAADWGRAILVAAIPLALLVGRLTMTQLYVSAVLIGALTVVFEVADKAFLPSVVPRAHWMTANSRLEAGGSLAEIGGTSLGGLLVTGLGAAGALLCDSVSFVLSALCLGRIRASEPPPVPASDSPGVREEIAAGLRVVGQNPILRALAGTAAVSAFFGNFIGATYDIYGLRVLHLSPTVVYFTIAVGGIGSLLGASLRHRTGDNRRAVVRFGVRLSAAARGRLRPSSGGHVDGHAVFRRHRRNCFRHQ